MIDPTNGEVIFSDGLLIRPHATVASLKTAPVASRPLETRGRAVKGWHRHYLGIHPSDYGKFSADLVSGPGGRIFMLLLFHSHPFYDTPSAGDSERRVFHSSVIASDLRGQSEFDWGTAHLHTEEEKNWLILVYQPTSPVARQGSFALSELSEWSPLPPPFESKD